MTDDDDKKVIHRIQIDNTNQEFMLVDAEDGEGSDIPTCVVISPHQVHIVGPFQFLLRFELAARSVAVQLTTNDQCVDPFDTFKFALALYFGERDGMWGMGVLYREDFSTQIIGIRCEVEFRDIMRNCAGYGRRATLICFNDCDLDHPGPSVTQAFPESLGMPEGYTVRMTNDEPSGDDTIN